MKTVKSRLAKGHAMRTYDGDYIAAINVPSCPGWDITGGFYLSPDSAKKEAEKVCRKLGLTLKWGPTPSLLWGEEADSTTTSPRRKS